MAYDSTKEIEGNSHSSKLNLYPSTKIKRPPIPLEIGGIPTQALIDTGASASLISTYIRQKILPNKILVKSGNVKAFTIVCGRKLASSEV